MTKKLSIKCVYGVKLGDSLLKLEDGSLLPIFPNTFYPNGTKAYWMLKRVGYNEVIIKVLLSCNREI